MATLKELARQVKIVAEHEGVEPSPDFTPGHRPYKVRLTYQHRAMTTPFFMGPALEHEPTAEEVLEALLSDASTFESTRSFEEWAAELGFDSDSRKAARIYRLTKMQTDKLKRLLSTDYEVFLYADRD